MLFGKKNAVNFGSYKLSKLSYFQIKCLKTEKDCRIRILKITYYFENLDGENLWNLELLLWKIKITKNGYQMLFGIINDVLLKL